MTRSYVGTVVPLPKDAADDASASARAGVPPMAWRPVSVIVGLFAAVLVSTSWGYGYFADEMYFRWAGDNPDWSYADQPLLLPLLARLMDTIAPESLVVLRLPTALLMAAGALITALIARELGGARRAQVLAAATFAISPYMVLFGRYLATATVDVVMTAAVSWLLVRWVRVRDHRLLLWCALVTALALQAKYLIVFFWAITALAVLILGPRELFRRRQLWIGAAIVAAAAAPAVIWQWANDWPQLRMGAVLSAEAQSTPIGFMLMVAVFCGFSGMVLLGVGLWRLVRRSDLRFLACSALGLMLLFLLLGWSSHLAVVMFPVLWGAGAVGIERLRGRWVLPVAWVAYVMGAFGLLYQLPVMPLSSMSETEKNMRLVVQYTAGWPELVDDIADQYQSLPPDERASATVVISRYELASAVYRYGADRGLPPAYSPHRGAWYFGSPPDSATTVIWVGELPDEIRDSFDDLELVGRADNGLGGDYFWHDQPIWVGRGQHEPWSQIWPDLRNL